MKKLIVSLMFSAIAFAGYNAAAQTIIPEAFKFSATVEAQLSNTFNNPTYTTTHSSTGTGSKLTTVTNYTTNAVTTLTKPVTLNDNKLVEMLAYSLSTTFARGSSLVIDSYYNIYVLSGTNYTSVSSVLTITPENILYSGKEKATTTVTTKGTNVTTKYSGGEALTETIAGKLTYDDSSLKTNGVTTFHVYGIAKAAYDIVDGATNITTGNFSVTGGVGTGIISNTPSILSDVTISGSYKVKEAN